MGYKEGSLKKDGTPREKPGRKSTPKVKSTFVRRAPRPHIWITGPNEFKHDMYHPWQVSKAQANFRKEGWTLTFDEFFELWRGHWHNRGREPDNMCMTRKDKNDAWSQDNVEIITRKEHLQNQGFARTGTMKYNMNYKKLKATK